MYEFIWVPLNTFIIGVFLGFLFNGERKNKRENDVVAETDCFGNVGKCICQKRIEDHTKHLLERLEKESSYTRNDGC